MKVVEKPDYGQALVCFHCTKRTVLYSIPQRLKEVFPSTENFFMNQYFSMFMVECRYTMEDELFPLLKEIFKEIKGKGFIMAFGVFLSGRYTESIIMTDVSDVCSLRCGMIEEVTGEEKENIRKDCENYMKRYEEILTEEILTEMPLNYYLSENEALPLYIKIMWGQNKEMTSKILVSTYFSWIQGIKRVKSLDDLYGDNINSGKWNFAFNKPEDIGYCYLCDGKGHIYEIEECIIDDLRSPGYKYMPFSHFIFLTKEQIRKILNEGWYMPISDTETFVVGKPGESREERDRREAADRKAIEDLKKGEKIGRSAKK